jgi:hypothetical protein
MRESCETAESEEVRRSPQRSSDGFQRCSNRGQQVISPDATPVNRVRAR